MSQPKHKTCLDLLRNVIKSSVTIAEVLYNVKNRSPFITSKSSSKNLSNENKHSLFFQTF